MVKQCLRFLLVLCLLPASCLAHAGRAARSQLRQATRLRRIANQPVDANQSDENQADENQAAPAAAAATAPLPVKYSPEGFPILQDGTPIRLRLTRTLSSADCKVGDRIDFEVEDPIILDGVTVIPQGSIAWGTVTDAEHKRRMTRGGKLAIEINEVQLANLQKAKLRATSEAKGGGHTGVMAGAMVGTAVVFWPVAPGLPADARQGGENSGGHRGDGLRGWRHDLRPREWRRRRPPPRRLRRRPLRDSRLRPRLPLVSHRRNSPHRVSRLPRRRLRSRIRNDRRNRKRNQRQPMRPTRS